MLHSLFSDTLILPNNSHLRFAITHSAGKQLNISRHVSTTSSGLVFNCARLVSFDISSSSFICSWKVYIKNKRAESEQHHQRSVSTYDYSKQNVESTLQFIKILQDLSCRREKVLCLCYIIHYMLHCYDTNWFKIYNRDVSEGKFGKERRSLKNGTGRISTGNVWYSKSLCYYSTVESTLKSSATSKMQPICLYVS